MSSSYSATSASDVTIPVPPLSLSSLDNNSDDDTLVSSNRDDVAKRVKARGSDVTDGAQTQRRKLKKLKSTGDVVTEAEEAALKQKKQKSRTLKRADSVDSDISGRTTARSILKRSSMEELPNFSNYYTASKNLNNIKANMTPRGSVTDRPLRRVSLARRVSFKGGYSEPPTPGKAGDNKKKVVSFGHSPRELNPVFYAPLGGGESERRRSSVFSQSPERGRGLYKRRESMMNMLRSELMKTSKLKLPDRPGFGQSGTKDDASKGQSEAKSDIAKGPTDTDRTFSDSVNLVHSRFDRRAFSLDMTQEEKEGKNLEVRKEKSSDEILWSKRKDNSKPPMQKRMSMPVLTRKDSARSTDDDDEDDVFMSTFHRRKLTLLSSLEKMGVKLPKRGQKFSNEEAEILKRAAERERHGSLTSRTILSNFDVKPKRKTQALSPEKPLDEVTRNKLQQIFDTMTKEDASAKTSEESEPFFRHTFNRRAEDKQVTALPGLLGRKRNDLTENEIAGSTAGVFMSRLRRRRGFAHAPRTLRHVTELPGVKVSHALINHSRDLFGKHVNDVGLYSGDIYNKMSPRPRSNGQNREDENEDDLHTDDFDEDCHTETLQHRENSGLNSTAEAGTRFQRNLKTLAKEKTTLPRLRQVQTETSLHPGPKRARALSFPAPKRTSERETFAFSKSRATGSSSFFGRSAVCNGATANLVETKNSDENKEPEDLIDTRSSDENGRATSLEDTRRRDENRNTNDHLSDTSRPNENRQSASLEDTKGQNQTRIHHQNLAKTKRQDENTEATSLEDLRRAFETKETKQFAEKTSADFGSLKPSLSLLAIRKRRIVRAKKNLGNFRSHPGTPSNGHNRTRHSGRKTVASGNKTSCALAGRRGQHRFRNLAKFVTLLLRAWRVHSLAVQAILDYHHTVDVTLDTEDKGGLLFDITEYKADTEARLSKEAIRILKKRPVERTSEEIHYVQVALWNYKSLAEYPVHMQKMIAERAWFESYGAKRVIVREGHLPMCFYFVLSGSALVSIMDLDKGVAKTVMYYNRGDSFGELAIMNGTRRQSTVISKDSIQLLVLSDTDFIEVFMSGGLSNPDDPFLNSVPCLDGWPKEKLAENPKKANYSYFKRGTVLAADSHKNDWIIIVKSGSISLLKKLKNVDARKIMAQRATQSFTDKIQELIEEEEERGLVTHEDRVEDAYQQRQDQIERLGHLARFYALPQIFVDTNESYNELKRQHDEFTELHGVSALHAREMAATVMSEHLTTQDPQLSRGVQHEPGQVGHRYLPHGSEEAQRSRQKGPFMGKLKREGSSTGDNAEILESRKNTGLSALFGHHTPSSDDVESKKGLSDLFCDNQPSMTLVSNGAECISISKKLYMEYATHAFITRIREDIYPYPSEEDLQSNLESQLVWDFHRRQVVTHVMQDIQWTRADKNDARLHVSPALGY